jgi:FAD/FMN-containing dehydrogenase
MAGPRARPDWEGLQRGISGQVLFPGSDAYQRTRPLFTAWFCDLQPRAVVRCAAAEDAAEAVAFARRHGLATAIRSGGHSFAGYSSTRGIVIDVTPWQRWWWPTAWPRWGPASASATCTSAWALTA